MDPDGLNLEAGVKALAILSFIPVVAFALWAEYFGQSINNLMIKHKTFEWKTDLEKLRLASFCIILFEITLFFGSREIREAYPVTTELAFSLSILLQFWTQNRTEKKLPYTNSIKNKKTHSMTSLLIRAALSWIIGAVTYILILLLTILGASWISDRLHVSPQIALFNLLVGASVGIALGLVLNLALSPFHLKKLFPTKPLEDYGLQSHLASCFTLYGLKSPGFLIIDLDDQQCGNSILAGFRHCTGPMRQMLFISGKMINTLSTTELRAVVTNQMSHILLKHFQKRFLMSFTLISASTILAVVCVVIGQLTALTHSVIAVAGPAVAISNLIASFRYLVGQAKKHEFEADVYTIEKLGVSFEDFANALRKTYQTQPPTYLELEVERRINLLTHYFSKSVDGSGTGSGAGKPITEGIGKGVASKIG